MPRDPECLRVAPEEPKARAGGRSRPWLAPAAALIAVIVLGLGAISWDRQRPATGAAPVDARALLRISATPDAVRGPEPTTREPVTMPATLALLASAAARIGDATTARGLADRLLDMSNKDAPGWGLGLPFDAFQDGSVNPPGAIYGTDTAFAAGALLEVFALTGEPRYREIAIQALDRFRGFQVRNAKGLFMAYSDQPSDRVPVFSNSALLMGQYARAGALANREDLATFADELFRGLWSERWDGELGVSWGYSAPNPFWNDAVHAAYIGLGMAIYARHRPGLELNAEATRRYLQSFVGESFVSEFAPNAKLKAKFIRPSPAPGPGMLMSALAELGDCETGQAISRRLGAYRRSDLRFGYRPDDRTYYPRANAHVVLGLATLERGCRGQRAGAP